MLRSQNIELECRAVDEIRRQPSLLDNSEIYVGLREVLNERILEQKADWPLLERVILIGKVAVPLLKDAVNGMAMTPARAEFAVALAALDDLSLKEDLLYSIRCRTGVRFLAAYYVSKNLIPEGKALIWHFIQEYLGQELTFKTSNDLLNLLDYYKIYPDSTTEEKYRLARADAEASIVRLLNRERRNS